MIDMKLPVMFYLMKTFRFPIKDSYSAIMAAKLKKRAMAEYNSSVVQLDDSNSSSSSVVSDRAKRLKLSLRESFSDVESVAMESPSLLPSLNTETLGVREVMANILGVKPR